MLLEREARLRAIIDVAFDGIVISEDGVIVEATDTVLARSGYRRDEIIGRPIVNFVAEEYREFVRQRQWAATEGRFDAIALTRSGERRRVEVISRNHVARGRNVRLLALRDVTNIRRLEQQVQHAQKMEVLGQLASGVAHDFNNVLTVIRGFADVLVEDMDERHRGDVQEIQKAVEAGSALIRQLLSFARQETDHPAAIDVNTVVRGAEAIVGRLLGPSVALVTDLADDVVTVRIDPMKLQQVILNLAINARDAMPLGGTLALWTRNEELVDGALPDAAAHAGFYTRLDVVDSGVGIPDHVRARIFEPFFTTKEAGKGTGLGLAIVQQIVERSGGFVQVASAPNVGSTFSIYLPHADSTA